MDDQAVITLQDNDDVRNGYGTAIEQDNDDVLLHDYAVVKHVRDVLLKKYYGNGVTPLSCRLVERFKQVDARYKELYPKASKIIDRRTQTEMMKFLKQKISDGILEPIVAATGPGANILSDMIIKFLNKRK